MEDTSDVYRTIDKASDEILFKEKKSKFFGYAFPIASEDEVKPLIEAIKKKHPSAGHICYAWQLGVQAISYRANDDGEPNNSAGMPIYGQIQSFTVTNVLIAVARIFGGTKLGVGGLIGAYRTGAQMALEASTIVKKTIKEEFTLSFSYTEMDIVMRTIKQNKLQITRQQFEITCELNITVRQKNAEHIKTTFSGIYGVVIKNKF